MFRGHRRAEVELLKAQNKDLLADLRKWEGVSIDLVDGLSVTRGILEALLDEVEEEWPKLRNPTHARHEPAPMVGARLRQATEKAKAAMEKLQREQGRKR